MIDAKSVFFDTAPFIYLLEQNSTFYEKSKELFRQCIDNNISICTSAITYEEYCIYPFMNNDVKLVDNFNSFIEALKIEVTYIDTSVATLASMLRAKYKGIKGMDALQLASAITIGADYFITNDKRLKQVKEIKVITLEK